MDLFPQLYRLTDRDEQTLLIQPEAAVLSISLTGASSGLAIFPASFPGIDRSFKIQRVSWRIFMPAGNGANDVKQLLLFVVDNQGVARDLIEARRSGAGSLVIPEIGNVSIIGNAGFSSEWQFTTALAEEFLVRPGGRLGISVLCNINPTVPPFLIEASVTGIAFPPGGIGR